MKKLLEIDSRDFERCLLIFIYANISDLKTPDLPDNLPDAHKLCKDLTEQNRAKPKRSRISSTSNKIPEKPIQPFNEKCAT